MARGNPPSAPYTYPINNSGNLSKSVGIKVQGFHGEIGTNVFYAKFLESGTSKMKPRKMMKEALNYTMQRTPKFKDLANAIQMVQK
jgi:HK97 gp10 family phage protein